MKPSKKIVATSVAAGSFAALVISTVVPFLTKWEGTDLVARRDTVGTGTPITYCHGQTSEFGKVKAGQRFTPAQCDTLLAKSLPTYLTPLMKCITREAPVKVIGAALDGSYNAGTEAMCKSPIVARINAGDFVGACNAFTGWYIRARGVVVRGLVNRRADERKFCLEGVAEGLATPPKSTALPWWQRWAAWIVGWFK